MGFTKLDERILQSSIMAESAITFKVWITLLASCQANGIAYVSAIYLSSICHLSLSRVEVALERLESPDPHSRSLADEGKRIKRVDGGYEIVNYDVYRNASLRDAEAERKRLYREKIKGCPDSAGRCPDPSASASASFFINKNLKEDEFDLLFEKLWKAWPSEGRFKKDDCRRKFNALVAAGKLEDYKATHKGYLQYLEIQEIERNFKQQPMHLSTFLNNWEGDKERYMNFRRKPPL